MLHMMMRFVVGLVGDLSECGYCGLGISDGESMDEMRGGKRNK